MFGVLIFFSTSTGTLKIIGLSSPSLNWWIYVVKFSDFASWSWESTQKHAKLRTVTGITQPHPQEGAYIALTRGQRSKFGPNPVTKLFTFSLQVWQPMPKVWAVGCAQNAFHLVIITIARFEWKLWCAIWATKCKTASNFITEGLTAWA